MLNRKKARGADSIPPFDDRIYQGGSDDLLVTETMYCAFNEWGIDFER